MAAHSAVCRDFRGPYSPTRHTSLASKSRRPPAGKSLDGGDAVNDRGDLFLIVRHAFAALDEHDAFVLGHFDAGEGEFNGGAARVFRVDGDHGGGHAAHGGRSEEHTSE